MPESNPEGHLPHEEKVEADSDRLRLYLHIPEATDMAVRAELDEALQGLGKNLARIFDRPVEDQAHLARLLSHSVGAELGHRITVVEAERNRHASGR